MKFCSAQFNKKFFNQDTTRKIRKTEFITSYTYIYGSKNGSSSGAAKTDEV